MLNAKEDIPPNCIQRQLLALRNTSAIAFRKSSLYRRSKSLVRDVNIYFIHTGLAGWANTRYIE